MKRIVYLAVFFLCLSSAYAILPLCVDNREEVYSLDTVTISLKVDDSNDLVIPGNNAVLDFRSVNEEKCYYPDDDLMVGKDIIMDFKIDNAIGQQILIGDGAVVTLTFSKTLAEAALVDIGEEQIETSCMGFEFVGDAVALQGTLRLNLPLCMLDHKDGSVLRICDELDILKCKESEEFVDIGLRYAYGGEVYKIAAEKGAPRSPLRIAKNGGVYGVALVRPTDKGASHIKIQTSSGVMALRLLD